MPQYKTIITVLDNSGVKSVKCIKIIKKFNKKGAFLNRFLIVSVKNFKPNKFSGLKIQKGQLFKAFVIRSKGKLKNSRGVCYWFNKSCVVLLNKQNNLVGTRIFGVLPKYAKQFKKIKLGAVALGFV